MLESKRGKGTCQRFFRAILPIVNLASMVIEFITFIAFAVLDKSMSASESDSDNSAPGVASSKPPKPPVGPSPAPFLPKASQMTSTPLLIYSKVHVSVYESCRFPLMPFLSFFFPLPPPLNISTSQASVGTCRGKPCYHRATVRKWVKFRISSPEIGRGWLWGRRGWRWRWRRGGGGWWR